VYILNIPDYEYHGMLAESWDLLRGDTSEWPDGPFYREIILRDGEPALDVGCGTGRLLLDFLASGLEVDGVDISLEMLDICRQKAGERGLDPTLYQQSMEQLDLPGKYRTIIIPSCSFQLLTDPEDATEALLRFNRHLATGGTLVMSIMDISRYSPSEWRFLVEKKRPEDGVIVRRSERARFDEESQLQHTENKYELLKEEEIIYTEIHRRSPATQHYSLAEIYSLLEDAGYTDVKAVVDASNKPASDSDGRFYISGRGA
jgi:ubiquinone/menaquinone biosynthesis C-methylase UbiE